MNHDFGEETIKSYHKGTQQLASEMYPPKTTSERLFCAIWGCGMISFWFYRVFMVAGMENPDEPGTPRAVLGLFFGVWIIGFFGAFGFAIYSICIGRVIIRECEPPAQSPALQGRPQYSPP